MCIEEVLLFFRRFEGIRKNDVFDVFDDEDHTLAASLISFEPDFLPVARRKMSAIPDIDDLDTTDMGLSTWKFESGRDEADKENKSRGLTGAENTLTSVGSGPCLPWSRLRCGQGDNRSFNRYSGITGKPLEEVLAQYAILVVTIYPCQSDIPHQEYSTHFKRPSAFATASAFSR